MSRLPRMRGDPPDLFWFESDVIASTPHARGSTLAALSPHLSVTVYPACAGIHLRGVALGNSSSGLPRMRGDPPGWQPGERPPAPSTPHARGSTFLAHRVDEGLQVYPACAGIHPVGLS